MAYTLTQLAADIRETLKADSGPAAKEKVCGLRVEVAHRPGLRRHASQGARAGANPREVLYEDPELGFCICGHVYGGPANGSPHDHGPAGRSTGRPSASPR